MLMMMLKDLIFMDEDISRVMENRLADTYQG
jgi:hypothetical protein